MRAVVGAELAHDVLHVGFDRVLRYLELSRDTSVGIARSDALQHFQFTGRKRVVRDMRRELSGNLARNMSMSRIHRAYGLEQVATNHALEQVSARAGLQRPQRLRIAPVGREHDD